MAIWTVLRKAGFAGILGFGLSLGNAAFSQQIDFTIGATDDPLSETLEQASLLRALQAEGGATALDLVAAARADYRRLLTALYAKGYYSGIISIRIDGREAASIAPLDAPDTVQRIVIAVDPGLRFTFGQTDIGPLAPGTILPEDFRQGAPARSETLRDAVAAAVAAWREEGRAKAAPGNQTILAQHADQRLDVQVAIVPGPVLTFGQVAVSGNIAVREDRILEIAGLPRGALYSPQEVARAEQRLRRTGAFRSASLVEAEQISPGDTLDFDIQVVEQKPRRLGFGVEYSSVEGLTTSGYWLHRNLLGGAESLRLDAKISGLGSETGGVDYQLSGAFLRPGTIHVDTDLFVNAQIERLDEPLYKLDQAGAEIGLTRQIGENLVLSGGVGVVSAKVTDSLGTWGYTLLTLPITGELDRRDDPLDAARGYYLSLEATPFVGISGVSSGGRLYADGRAYRSFGPTDKVTLAFRGQAGTVFGTDATRTPTDFLFYSGGGDTVRGQSYQSLGVDLGGGVTIGGLSFLAVSAEVRLDITDKLGAVGFYDAGFVGADSLSWGNGNWHSGAGLGIRYDTGIGPIRLDVATPTSGPSAGQSVSFYVGIGQSF